MNNPVGATAQKQFASTSLQELQEEKRNAHHSQHNWTHLNVAHCQLFALAGSGEARVEGTLVPHHYMCIIFMQYSAKSVQLTRANYFGPWSLCTRVR
jgi:hypothetical protein